MLRFNLRHQVLTWLLPLLLAALWSPAAAHPGVPDQYRFRHLTSEHGLSQGTVNAIQQDSDGFVWLATQDGLNRFDGSTFRIFTNDLDDPRSLGANGIWCLGLDGQGRLWYGTEDAGFGYYDPATDNFTNFRFDPKVPDTLEAYDVADLLVHPDQTIWLATASHGILHFDPADSSLTAYTPEAGGPVRVPTTETWTVAVDRDGAVWAGTSDGLVEFGADHQPVRVFTHSADDSTSLVSGSVYRLSVDSRNRLWVGTVGGLDLLDRAAGRFRHFKADPLNEASLSAASVSGIAEGPDGRIWVATMTGGLNVLDLLDNTVTRLQHDPLDPYSPASDALNELAIDADGLLWIAGQKGAEVLNLKAKKFHHLGPGTLSNGKLGNAFVWAVAEDRRGELWVGTEDGLHRFKPRGNLMSVYRHDKTDSTSVCNSSFSLVHSDSRGELWLGSDRGGLGRYDFARDRFLNYGVDGRGPARLRKTRFFGVSESARGELWFATMSGLLEYDATADTFRVHAADSTGRGLSDSRLRAVQADSRGLVWVGTWSETLECYDPRTGEARRFKHDPGNPNSLSNNVVICFLEDDRQRLWVGTGNGLNLYDYDQGTFRRFGVKDGLPNATIYGLLAAPDGDLWISTNLGLSRFDPERLTFDNYDVSDGLQSNEFNSQSCSLGGSGEMYFGGINGLTIFKPAEIRNSALQPRLAITDFQVLNRPVGVGVESNGHVLLSQPIHRTEAIRLRPSDRVVTLEFAAFDYAAAKGVSCAYMLEGFDTEWHYVTNHRYATYTNLPPGDFQFRVRGTNHDGVWSPHEARLAVTMQPPFWRAPWFIFLATLSGLGLLRAYYTYRTRMMRRRNHELEDKVALRTADLELEIEERVRTEDRLREATGQALAATRAKTEFLANMSHEIRTPLNGVIGLTGALLDTRLDEEQSEYCQMVQSSANALLMVINDVLDFSKMEVGKLELEAIDFRPRDVVDEIADMLGWQAFEKGLVYVGVVAADVPSVFSGDPGRIRQVLLNLVGNAIKFTSSGRVEVRVSVVGDPGQEPRLVRWAVRDTGVGIPAAKQRLLFRSFSQVDASTTRRYGGTGLGLAISKQLVDLMGGRIGCESSEGEGATFWLEIPLAVVSLAPAAGLLQSSAPAPILLVSCEEQEHEVLGNHLKHCGLVLVTVRDTAEALAAVSGPQLPCVVIIGRLPDREEPADLANLLRGRDGVPVAPLLLLSDLGERMDHRELKDHGFHSVLTWPLRYQRLLKVLDELAGEKTAAGQRTITQPEPASDGEGPPHLLLAEDNPVNQRVAGLILSKLGFTYDVVGTGAAAVAALKLRRYDAVLMDVQMPEMDGLEATRAIRDPSTRVLNPQVPILAMTAHAMASDRTRCLEAGMNDHLTKPIQSAGIAEALGKYLGVPQAG